MNEKQSEKLIFEVSRRGRTAFAQNPGTGVDLSSIPASLRRTDKPQLPEVSEMQTVRHFTRLSQLHFSIDRSEEHTSELQSLMRISSAVFCLNKKNTILSPEIKTQIARAPPESKSRN